MKGHSNGGKVGFLLPGLAVVLVLLVAAVIYVVYSRYTEEGASQDYQIEAPTAEQGHSPEQGKQTEAGKTEAAVTTTEPAEKPNPLNEVLDAYESFLKNITSYTFAAYSKEPYKEEDTSNMDYALLECTGDDIPELGIRILSANNYQGIVIFYYDSADKSVHEAQGSMVEGVAGVGGFRGSVWLSSEHNSFLSIELSSGTGETSYVRYTLENGKLNYKPLVNTTYEESKNEALMKKYDEEYGLDSLDKINWLPFRSGLDLHRPLMIPPRYDEPRLAYELQYELRAFPYEQYYYDDLKRKARKLDPSLVDYVLLLPDESGNRYLVFRYADKQGGNAYEYYSFTDKRRFFSPLYGAGVPEDLKGKALAMSSWLTAADPVNPAQYE